MSFLTDLRSYWQGNTPLNTALPATSVFMGIQPAGTAMPYAVLTVLGSLPTWTTGKGYFEGFSFQVSIFHTSLASLEALALVVMNNLDWQTISAPTMSMMRTNYLIIQDPDTPQKTYHAMIEYMLTENRQLP